jgi:hypothetical protein
MKIGLLPYSELPTRIEEEKDPLGQLAKIMVYSILITLIYVIFTAKERLSILRRIVLQNPL